MLAEEKAIGPQTHAPDRPCIIGIVAVFFGAAIDEAVFEFVECQLQVGGSLRCITGAQTFAPVFVHPLKMYRID